MSSSSVSSILKMGAFETAAVVSVSCGAGSFEDGALIDRFLFVPAAALPVEFSL